MTPEKKAAQFPCPGCAADMQFDPATGGMKCPFCGQTQALRRAGRRRRVPLARVRRVRGRRRMRNCSRSPARRSQVSCDGCGSVVAFEPPEVAGICPFCGDALVAQAKAADPLIAPDGLLPAKVPKEQAAAEVKQWLQSRWFAPNALKRFARPEGINGVYLPFWDYDADTDSRYTGARGQHYYETEYYTETDNNGNTVQRSRQVQRTAWYPCAGRGVAAFRGRPGGGFEGGERSQIKRPGTVGPGVHAALRTGVSLGLQGPALPVGTAGWLRKSQGHHAEHHRRGRARAISAATNSASTTSRRCTPM